MTMPRRARRTFSLAPEEASYIDALVASGAYESPSEVVRAGLAARLVTDRFDSLSRIGKVKAPILLLRGERDRVVPVRYGQALLDAAPEPKEGWFAPEAGHEDLARYGGLDAVVAFIDRRLGG
jgi:hypothetical protein